MPKPTIVTRDEWTRGPQAPARQGEGADPPARRAERRASQAADGGDREGIRVRGARRGGTPHTRRSIRQEVAAHRLPFHVPVSLPIGRTRAVPPARMWSTTCRAASCISPRATRHSLLSRVRHSQESNPSSSAWDGRFRGCRRNGTDFNEDFGVTLDKTHTVYNYAPVSPPNPRAGRTKASGKA